jgi:Rod binding domain-containing protein
MIDGIGALYHLKASDPGQALIKACKEFETIFAHQILKTMGATLEEGFSGGGLAGDMYDDLLYMELARKVCEGRGLGLAAVVEQQLRQRFSGQLESKGGQDASDNTVWRTNR